MESNHIEDKQNDKLNDNANAVLEVLKINPTATTDDLIEATGKSQSTIARDLKRYQESGLIHREGSRRNGKWVIH